MCRQKIENYLRLWPACQDYNPCAPRPTQPIWRSRSRSSCFSTTPWWGSGYHCQWECAYGGNRTSSDLSPASDQGRGNHCQHGSWGTHLGRGEGDKTNSREETANMSGHQRAPSKGSKTSSRVETAIARAPALAHTQKGTSLSVGWRMLSTWRTHNDAST